MRNEELGLFLTAASLLIAVITFGVSSYLKYRTDRLTRTLDFLRTIYEHDGPIRQANIELALWLNNKENFDFGGETNTDTDKKKTLIVLMSYFDLIADSANRGIVDSEMIVIHLGGKMRSVHKMAASYIFKLRKDLGRPGIYKPFEKFVNTQIENREV